MNLQIYVFVSMKSGKVVDDYILFDDVLNHWISLSVK